MDEQPPTTDRTPSPTLQRIPRKNPTPRKHIRLSNDQESIGPAVNMSGNEELVCGGIAPASNDTNPDTLVNNEAPAEEECGKDQYLSTCDEKLEMIDQNLKKGKKSREGLSRKRCRLSAKQSGRVKKRKKTNFNSERSKDNYDEKASDTESITSTAVSSQESTKPTNCPQSVLITPKQTSSISHSSQSTPTKPPSSCTHSLQNTPAKTELAPDQISALFQQLNSLGASVSPSVTRTATTPHHARSRRSLYSPGSSIKKRRKYTPVKFPWQTHTPSKSPSRSTFKRKLYQISPSDSPNGSEASQTTPSKLLPRSPRTPLRKSPRKGALSLNPQSGSYSPQLGDDLNLDLTPMADSSIDIEDQLEIASVEAPPSEASTDLHDSIDIDEVLEGKSQKFNFTAKNVKTLIKEVIKNENIMHMFQKTMEEDNLEEQFHDAVFRPKMTRSRVKEVLEKGDGPLPWTLTPIKTPADDRTATSATNQLLELTFSDEDDDEYRPSADELEHLSDEESMLSSQASDVGTPLPTTPCDSSLFSPPDSSTPDSTTTTCQKTSMGPPPSVPRSVCRNIAKELDEEANIAFRTRSRLPLKDTPLEKIESEFVAPDITEDMYDTNCDDTEWSGFLASLYTASNNCNDVLDDDTNDDPEYEYKLDEEKQHLEEPEECRDDKAVKVTKKELTELIDELFEMYGGAQLLSSDDDKQNDQKTSISQHSSPAAKTGKTSPRCAGKAEKKTSAVHETEQGVNECTEEDDSVKKEVSSEEEEGGRGYPGVLQPLNFDPKVAHVLITDLKKISGKDTNAARPRQASVTITCDELLQLRDQMRKHVQLLAQTFVQASSRAAATQEDVDALDLQLARDIAMGYLAELKKLSKEYCSSHDQSYFMTPNLDGAISLTNKTYLCQNEERQTQLRTVVTDQISAKMYDICGLSYEQMDVLSGSAVFLFPQMLPDCALLPKEISINRGRVMFSEAEDCLLAMGLDQFGHLPNKYLLVHKYLIPVKNREQLRFRIKNCRSARTSDNNVLLYYLEKGHLPDDLPRYKELELEENIVPPCKRHPSQMPNWWNGFSQVENQRRARQFGEATWMSLGALKNSQTCSGGDPKNSVASPQDMHTVIDCTESLPDIRSPASSDTLPDLPKEKPGHVALPQVTLGYGMSSLSRLNIRSSSPILSQPSSPALLAARNETRTTDKPLSPLAVSSPKASVKLSSGKKSSEKASVKMAGPSRPVKRVQTKPTVKKTCVSVAPAPSSGNISSVSSSLPAAINTVSANVDLQRVIGQNSSAAPPVIILTPVVPQVAGVSVITVPQNAALPVSSMTQQTTVIPVTSVTPVSSVTMTSVVCTTSVNSSPPLTSISPVRSSTPTNSPIPMASVASPNFDRSLRDLLKGLNPELFASPTSSPVKTSTASGSDDNLISHAFSQATGIPLAELNSPEFRKKIETFSPMKSRYDNESAAGDAACDEGVTEQSVRSTEGTALQSQLLGDRSNITNKSDLVKCEGCTEVSESSPITADCLDADEMETAELQESAPTNIVSMEIGCLARPASPACTTVDSMIETTACENTEVSATNKEANDNEVDVKSNENLSNNSPDDRTVDGEVMITTDSLPVVEADSEDPRTSCKASSTPTETESSQLVHADVQFDSPNKNALHMISQLSGMVTPTKCFPQWSPASTPPSGRALVKVPSSPNSGTPTSSNKSPYRYILPKSQPSAENKLTAINIPKRSSRSNPRRQILQQKARAIAPKGIIIRSFVSPIKKAAEKVVKKRLGRSPSKPPCRNPVVRKILPKPQSTRKEDLIVEEGVGAMSDDEGIGLGAAEKETWRSEGSDGGEGEEEDLAQLMVASTTIRSAMPARRQLSNEYRKMSKADQKREVLLEMLSPELLEADSRRDERDTRFAQEYLYTVRRKLVNSPDVYSSFLQALYEFGRSEHTPVELYKTLTDIFEEHPDLLCEFAGFLLPEQARQCGCLERNLHIHAVRLFTRKLEIQLHRTPSQLQRIFKEFIKWEKDPEATNKDLKEAVEPLLRGHDYLLSEFLHLFDDERPPESSMSAFEQVTLPDSDDEDFLQTDSFEEVELPDSDTENSLGTMQCCCKCHSVRNALYARRKRHCKTCALRILKGRLYMQTTDKVLQPMKVVYLSSPNRPRSVDDEEEEEEDDDDDDDLEDEDGDKTQSLDEEDESQLSSDDCDWLEEEEGEEPDSQPPIRKKAFKQEEIPFSCDPVPHTKAASPGLASITEVLPVSEPPPVTGPLSVREPMSVTGQMEQTGSGPLSFTEPPSVTGPLSSFTGSLSVTGHIPTSTDLPVTGHQSSVTPPLITGPVSVTGPPSVSEPSLEEAFDEAQQEAAISSLTTQQPVTGPTDFHTALKNELEKSPEATDCPPQLQCDSVLNDIHSEAVESAESGICQVLSERQEDTTSDDCHSPPPVSEGDVKRGGLVFRFELNRVNVGQSKATLLSGCGDGAKCDNDDTFHSEDSVVVSTQSSSVSACSSSTQSSDYSSSLSGVMSRREDTSLPVGDAEDEDVSLMSGYGESSASCWSLASSDEVFNDWTREEDRIILEICKAKGANAQTFQEISQQLTDKSTKQVKARFCQLMRLLTDGQSDTSLCDSDTDD